jgi:hypothetical protein
MKRKKYGSSIEKKDEDDETSQPSQRYLPVIHTTGRCHQEGSSASRYQFEKAHKDTGGKEGKEGVYERNCVWLRVCVCVYSCVCVCVCMFVRACVTSYIVPNSGSMSGEEKYEKEPYSILQVLVFAFRFTTSFTRCCCLLLDLLLPSENDEKEP